MAQLEKYIKAKNKITGGGVIQKDQLYTTFTYKGKSYNKNKDELIGQVISTNHTRESNVGTDGVMATAARDNAACLFIPKAGFETQFYLVRFFNTKGLLGSAYTFHPSDIQKAPDEYQSADGLIRLHEENLDRIAKINKAKYESELEHITELLKPIEEPFNQINFLAIQTFNTQRQIMQMVCANENGLLYKYNQYYGEKIDDIIANEKDSGDFLLYLPTQWVSAVGYSEERVKRWIDFINSFGLDIPVEYLGIDSRKEFKEYPSLRDYQMGGIDLASVINKNEFYLIKINACECGSINYFVFRLIMSLYHTWTKWIPGLAMQIKDDLGDSISTWEAYMLAINTDASGTLADVTNSGNGRPKYVNIFSKKNNIKRFIDNLSVAKGRPGQSLVYHDVTVDKAKRIDLSFGAKDFRTLYDLFGQLKEK